MNDDPNAARTVREEEEAAAAEARRIGGRSGMEGMDPAERASAEHGGGEREGFEEAEDLLEKQATHGDPSVDPLRDAPAPEAEEQVAVYGEADEVDIDKEARDAEDEPAG